MPGRARPCRLGFFSSASDHIGRKRIERNIGAALAKFERARSRIRHNGEANAGELRLCSPVIVVALKNDIFILLGVNELEWA